MECIFERSFFVKYFRFNHRDTYRFDIEQTAVNSTNHLTRAMMIDYRTRSMPPAEV